MNTTNTANPEWEMYVSAAVPYLFCTQTWLCKLICSTWLCKLSWFRSQPRLSTMTIWGYNIIPFLSTGYDCIFPTGHSTINLETWSNSAVITGCCPQSPETTDKNNNRLRHDSPLIQSLITKLCTSVLKGQPFSKTSASFDYLFALYL